MIVRDKKSIHEIERDIEKLHEKHSKSIDEWMKSRIEEIERAQKKSLQIKDVA